MAMLLVIDVGNTNTKIGVCDGERVLVSWTLTTRREQTADEYGVFTEAILRTRGITPRDIEGVAISNVVPPVQQALERMAEQYFGVTALSVAPGISVAVDALLSRAARLFRVELVRPKEAIGRSTVTNIQSGVVYGYAGLVDGLVERMRQELDGDVKVVATGGLAQQMREVAGSIQEVNPNLRLEGLRMIWEQAQPST